MQKASVSKVKVSNYDDQGRKVDSDSGSDENKIPSPSIRVGRFDEDEESRGFAIKVVDNSTKEEMQKEKVIKEEVNSGSKSDENKTVMFDLQLEKRNHQFLDFILFIRLLIAELRILMLVTHGVSNSRSPG